jgi:CheY-like chemotaxis protein
MSSLPPPEFEQLVRDALNHLYDTSYLQNHPLASLPASHPGDRGALRGKRLLQALLDAIDSLHPPQGTPSSQRAWRIFTLFSLRYVEGVGFTEVLRRLNISSTQYKRDHTRGLEGVASMLRERWIPDAPSLRAADVDQSRSRERMAIGEAKQVTAGMRRDHIDLLELVETISTRLIEGLGGKAEPFLIDAAPNLPPIVADRNAVQHSLLILLDWAMTRWNNRVLIGLAKIESQLELRIDILLDVSTAGEAAQPDDASTELEVARQLVEASGGSLDIQASGRTGRWVARAQFPIVRAPTVLVMDNDLEFISMVGRYLADAGWQVVGAHDIEHASALALEIRPDAILMDVLMLGQSGWDLLPALRHQAETREIPVIVCSVLFELQIARALGAVDYLPKPFTQQQLLETLARWHRSRATPG